MTMQAYDGLVIGGGTAGTAAASAAQAALGPAGRVAMFNKGELGGLCILRGCMPTKTMLHAAHVVHEAGHHKTPGVGRGGLAIDFAAVMANKDAKGDLEAPQWAMARSDLGWYSGDDVLNLPLLALGANGFISVVGHLVADRIRAMAETFHAGDVCGAIAANRALLPVYTGIFRTQGVILTKAALALQGLPGGPVRSPLVDATADQIEQLEHDLREGGVDLS